MYNNRHQISDGLGNKGVEEEQEEEITKGRGEILVEGVKDMFIILILVRWSHSEVYTYFKIYQMYTLNMCSLLYGNYI